MKKFPKPYNSYNIFFILERALLLEARQSGATAVSSETTRPRPSSSANNDTAPFTGYEFIELPRLPPRYKHLESSLKANWYDPGGKKNAKRKHTKSHGVASFREIARTVADNWKSIDPASKIYVEAVAALLKCRYKQLEELGGMGCLSVGTSAKLPTPMSMPEPCVVTPTSTLMPRKNIKKWLQNKAAAAAQESVHSVTMPSSSPCTSADTRASFVSTSSDTRASVASTSSNMEDYIKDVADTCTSSNFLRIDQDMILDTANPMVPDMISLSRIVSDEAISSTISLDSNMRCGKLCKEVDVSDLDILSFYHSI